MPWYNPIDDLRGLGSGLKNVYNTITGPADQAAAQANANARAGSYGFAQQAQGNYGQNTQSLNNAIAALQAQANGSNSVSAMQLKQSLGQALAQQQALQAGADPRNQAAAARQAMINSGRLSSGLAGQQALAGLQERNQAQAALASALLGARGQDVQGTVGGYQNAISQAGDKSWSEKNAGLLSAGAGLAGVVSDERHKTRVKDGDAKATSFLEALSAKSYRYKRDAERAGAGRGDQLGIMAQDLEREVPDAVVNTSVGKVVHAGKLAGALAAAASSMHKRIKRLEEDE